jgi:signal transduction histidine kinase
MQSLTWHGATELDTLLDLTAALVGLIVGIVVLLCFYSKGDPTFLFVGSGLVGTGLLDMAHTIVTSSFFGGDTRLSSSSLLPWSWIASSLFLSMVLWLSWLIWRQERRRGTPLRIKEGKVYLSVGVFTLLSFVVYFFARLPRAYFPHVIGRPEDLLPAGLFLLALGGYLSKGWWRRDPFEHWIVLALIVSFMCHVIMALSRQPFDVLFYGAHFLKVVGYLCLLVGSLSSMYSIVKQAETSAAELARQSGAMQIEIIERRRTEQALAAQAAELEAFSYSVSHDLRAPLRRIDGFCQILLDDYAPQLDSTGRDYLQRVRAASQHMEQLIEDILALSRVTRSEMRRGTVDLSALARGIAADLQQAEPHRSIEFSIADGLLVEGDGRLLQVALENLLGNACKFTMHRAHARIEVGATRSGQELVYFVRDNGVGFDMAYASKLFSPFQRLHNARDFAGTGIGLATVQRIVHRHGGRVWAEGVVDQGATFYFAL